MVNVVVVVLVLLGNMLFSYHHLFVVLVILVVWLVMVDLHRNVLLVRKLVVILSRMGIVYLLVLLRNFIAPHYLNASLVVYRVLLVWLAQLTVHLVIQLHILPAVTHVRVHVQLILIDLIWYANPAQRTALHAQVQLIAQLVLPQQQYSIIMYVILTVQQVHIP